MSKKDKTIPHEPAKRAPQVQPPVQQKAPPRRGFFRSLFSHLIFAGVAVVAVGSYLHWDDILKYTGNNVCSYNMLGKYITDPVKVPPIEAKKKFQSEPKTNPAEAAKPTASAEPAPKPGKITPGDTVAPAKSPPAPVVAEPQKKTPPKADAGDMNSAWQAARKLFWQNNAQAETAYEKLSARFPQQAEILEELGNVYYKNAKQDKAVETYLKAGNRFADLKNNKRAEAILKIVKKLAPEKSKDLAAKLSQQTQ